MPSLPPFFLLFPFFFPPLFPFFPLFFTFSLFSPSISLSSPNPSSVGGAPVWKTRGAGSNPIPCRKIFPHTVMFGHLHDMYSIASLFTMFSMMHSHSPCSPEDDDAESCTLHILFPSSTRIHPLNETGGWRRERSEVEDGRRSGRKGGKSMYMYNEGRRGTCSGGRPNHIY